MAFDSNRHHQIEQFLYHEAFLADENGFFPAVLPPGRTLDLRFSLA